MVLNLFSQITVALCPVTLFWNNVSAPVFHVSCSSMTTFFFFNLLSVWSMLQSESFHLWHHSWNISWQNKGIILWVCCLMLGVFFKLEGFVDSICWVSWSCIEDLKCSGNKDQRLIYSGIRIVKLYITNLFLQKSSLYCVQLAPENTVMSFNSSVRCNVAAFETDVQLRYVGSKGHISTVNLGSAFLC